MEFEAKPMATDGAGADVVIVLHADGMTRRLGDEAKWRKAITLRHLRRDSTVELEIDGRGTGLQRAADLAVLSPIFDELDPAPPADLPLAVPVIEAAPVAPPPASTRASGWSSAGSSSVAPRAEPPGGVTRPGPQPASATTSGPKSAGGAWSGASGTVEIVTPPARRGVPAWVYIVALVGLFFVVMTISRISGLRREPVAHSDAPPYPITAFSSPRDEVVSAAGLNVRSGPGRQYSTVRNQPLTQGEHVSGIGEATSTENGRWQYVRLQDGAYGYVNARNLKPAT